ncbi:MAG: D-alanyl-D-alanine carboxypeptidase family protein, partial [bacterium]|nr:D-alanyl-D-alanine carboxypeptidase family protein [bacterium]
SAYPVKITNVMPPEITASAAAVFDFDSGVPLFQKAVNRRLKPASITKLMTALVALDVYQPEDIITITNLALLPGEAKMGLKIGDQITVNNLLYGMLVPSGNDAAYVLADNYPGFINLMNLKAVKLNMTHTYFNNPAGRDELNHYTTVSDLGILARAALNNKLIAQIVKTNWTVVYDITGLKRYPLQNVNQLLVNYWGTIGIKTGYTQEANQCLVAAVSRRNQTLISIILGSADRFGESIQLLNWGFTNFRPTAEKDLRE